MQDLSKTPDGKPIAPIFRGFQRDLPISYEHQMENLCDPVSCTATCWTALGCRVLEDRRRPYTPASMISSCQDATMLLCLHGFFAHGTVAESGCSVLPQAHFNFVHHGVAADK